MAREVIHKLGIGDCATCPARDNCTTLCSAMEAKLPQEIGVSIRYDDDPYCEEWLDHQEIIPSQPTIAGTIPPAVLEEIEEIIETKLTDRQRQAINLRFFESLPISQIARKLGIDWTAAYRLLERAYDRIINDSQLL